MKVKLLLSLIFLMYYTSIICQTQYGFMVEVNSTIINSEDLINVKSKTGFGIGFTTLTALHHSADLIGEINYTNRFISIDGFKDFNENEIVTESTDYKIENFSLDFAYNQYLIIPNLNKFNLALQSGFGLSFLNNWTLKDGDNNTIFDRDGTIEPMFSFGISGGTEQLRITIKYQSLLSNSLKEIYVNDTPNQFNEYERREFQGKQKYYSITLTYFLGEFNF